MYWDQAASSASDCSGHSACFGALNPVEPLGAAPAGVAGPATTGTALGTDGHFELSFRESEMLTAM
eukprot:6179118-Pleurochrysis_carterae.AAC.1